MLENICKTASVPCPKVCKIAKALYPGVSIPKSAVDYERARRDLRRELVRGYAFCSRRYRTYIVTRPAYRSGGGGTLARARTGFCAPLPSLLACSVCGAPPPDVDCQRMTRTRRGDKFDGRGPFP